MKWSKISPPLSSPVLESITNLQFQESTPVQEAAIPHFLSNKDVVVQAETGSGKTLAFVIPVIEILLRRKSPLKKNQVGAIIITPTRELAMQISECLSLFVKNANESMEGKEDCLPFSQCLLIGGTKSVKDIASLKTNGGNILIATPGRLEDIICRKRLLDVRELEVLILDEADRLLDLGFEKSLSNIIRSLPKQRRTGLFSATMNDAMGSLIRLGLRNPLKISYETPATLRALYKVLPLEQKLADFLGNVTSLNGEKILVYFATCALVDFYFAVLSQGELSKYLHTHDVFAFHGKMDGKKREELYAKFKESPKAVLLTTDVFSRGLDIPDVDWVIQFDPPQDPRTFTHRCGRTARAGKSGSALLYVTEVEEPFIDFLRIQNSMALELVTEVTDVNLETLTASINSSLQSLCATSEESFFLAKKACVSWIRYYQEHQ
ncbi:P-loop containing nucleoside triphosphate hydrolase protein, partial [Chytridium lagenaria]